VTVSARDAGGNRSHAAPIVGLVCGLFAGLMPGEAAAQRVQLVPKAGVYTALGPLTENTEIEPGLAFGGAIEVGLPIVPIALRLTVDYALDVEIVRRGTTEERVGDVSLLGVVGDVVLRPLPGAVIARPYFLLGGGIKRYTMTLETTGGGDLSGVDENLSRATVHAGGGFDVRVGPVALVLEVGDYLSTFVDAAGDSKVQHDAFGQAGLRITVF
jgi:hypothetical protein